MANIVDKLGLNLKTKLRYDPKETNIGDKIINDAAKMNAQADKQDFSNYTKKEYVSLLEDTLNDGVKKFIGDFFIEVSFTVDILLKKVFKLIPMLRSTCPLPFYGKDTFMYDHKKGKLELLWAIPSKQLCENPHLLPLGIPGNDKLLDTIKNFNKGLYFNIYLKINKDLEK